MKRIISMLAVLMILVASCKKDTKEQTPQKPPAGELPREVTTKIITLLFPANTPVEAASCSVYSQSFTSYAEKDGSYKIAYEQGFPNIAWVFDKNKNVILAGFITDSAKTISVASTAEVLLYFGLGTTFQPAEVINKYIAGNNTIPGMTAWKAQLEDIFKKDPQMLNKHLFAEALQAKVAEVLAAGTTTERKPADVTVDANDIRSGLQIAENGLNSYIITNSIRRRSYAYLYKMNYKDVNGQSHTVNSSIGGSITSLSETKLSPTTAIRDYKGVLQDWAAGNGEKFAVTTSSPIDVPLEDNESIANFKVRVIGPGKPVSMPMTTYERERWWNVTLQTALFDFLLPAVLDVMGHKEFLNNINAPGNKLEGLEDMVKKTGDLIAVIPTVSDALEAGDYSTLVSDVFYTIANGKLSGKTDDFIKSIYYAMGNYVMKAGSNYYEDPSAFDDRAENLVKILEVVDIGMKAIDYGRIAKAIIQSKTVEEWDLKASEVKITLAPGEFTIGKGASQKLTAYIKTSLGTDPPGIEYEWKSSGKYGSLSDDRGHTGNSFSSSLPDVVYQVRNEDFGDGEHKETITVTVYTKKGQERSKMGSSSSVATISKNETVVAPAITHVNIQPTGKDSKGNQLYSASNAYWTASIKPRSGAKSYTMRVIKNGQKMNPTKVTPNPSDTAWAFRGQIGTGPIYGTDCTRSGLFGMFDLDESQMLKEKARQEALIGCWQGLGFTGVEFTIEY